MPPAWKRLLAIVLALSSCLGCPVPARASDDGSPRRSGVYWHLAAGPSYMRESWRVGAAGADAAVTFGWGPSLEVAVGRSMASGWVVAGSLQLTGIFDRGETYRGQSYELASTAHLVDVLAVLLDYQPHLGFRAHLGGSLGILGLTDVDTYNGATQTNWGVAASLHAGKDLFRWGRWSAGVVARLAYYRCGSDAPAPPTTVNGLLPSLLVGFTRD